MSNYPKELKYTKDHEWVKIDGDKLRVGISAHAVEQLGDITLVELPKVGTKFAAHAQFGVVESTKTVSELFAPVACEVIEVNEALVSQPELVNDSPYEKGWMLVVKASESIDALLDVAAYEAHVSAG